MRERAHNDVYDTGVKKDLEEQRGQKRERHVASGISRFAAYHQSAFESAVAEHEQQQGFEPALRSGWAEMQRHVQFGMKEGDGEAGDDKQSQEADFHGREDVADSFAGFYPDVVQECQMADEHGDQADLGEFSVEGGNELTVIVSEKVSGRGGRG